MILLDAKRSLTVPRPLGRPTVPRVVHAILRGLEDARASSVTTHENRIEFRGGVFRLVTSANLLAGICKGKVEVWAAENGIRMEYALSFREILVLSVLAAGFGGVAGAGMFEMTGGNAILWGVVLFACFFFINRTIALGGFRAFLKKSVKHAGVSPDDAVQMDATEETGIE